MKRVYVLLGGMAGWADGWAVNSGMNALAEQIKQLSDVTCSTHYWTSWANVARAIQFLDPPTKVVLIGYSGGGSRITWITEQVKPTKIDLVVGYDPSPVSSMGPFLGNVAEALCYTNKFPNWAGLGGGHFTGTGKIETTEFNPPKNHLAVQFDQELHRRTLQAIVDLCGGYHD